MLTLLPPVAIGEKILMLCVGTGRDRQLLAAGREPLATDLPSEYLPNHNTGHHPYGRLRHLMHRTTLFLATRVWVFKPPWQSNSPT